MTWRNAYIDRESHTPLCSVYKLYIQYNFRIGFFNCSHSLKSIIFMIYSLAFQGLRLHASKAGGTGSIPGRGTKIPHAAWCGQKKKRKKSIILKINLFIFYFWLCWVFVAVHRLSLVAASGGYSSLWSAGFSLQWLLFLRRTGSRCTGFSSCGTWAQ